MVFRTWVETLTQPASAIRVWVIVWGCMAPCAAAQPVTPAPHDESTDHVSASQPTPIQHQHPTKPRANGSQAQRISLNFKRIELRTLLQVFAHFTSMNVVVSDDVQGHVTLALDSVPWDQALATILAANDLAKRQHGNVIWIAPAPIITAQELKALQSRKHRDAFEPLHTQVISLRYATAKTMASLLKRSQGALSPRGSVLVDERTNTLVVRDISRKRDAIAHMVATLDKPIKQVMVEAKMVITTAEKGKQIGVQWGGFQHNSSSATDNQWVLAGSADAAEDLRDNNSVSVDSFVDLSTNAPNSSRLNIGYLTDNALLNLELSAMELSGQGEVISQPKIITGDKQAAKITSGQEVAYNESAPNGGTTVKFKEVALVLEVTPSITPDNRIHMNLDIRQDSIVGETTTGVPVLDITRLQTQVKVDNDQTIVLGGVYQQKQSDKTIKVPWLGDIPIIGRLFKRTNRSYQKTELLIFITPKIIEGI